MSIYQKKQKLTEKYDNGIWLDYQNATWLFFIKDDVWVPEEVQRAEKAEVKVTFARKGIVNLFLLEIFDCLETSDLPFCMKDMDPEMVPEMLKGNQDGFEIVLINGKNEVVCTREGKFTKKNTALLHEALAQDVDAGFTGEDFDRAYMKLVKAYEPFEMEQFAVFAQQGKENA